MDLILKPEDDVPSARGTSSASAGAAARSTTPVPQAASFLTPQPTSSPPALHVPETTGVVSQRVRDIVDAARQQVPPDNATIKLITAMAALEDVIPDAAARRVAALKVLASQGVTQKDIDSGIKEAKRALEGVFSGLLAQTDAARKSDVDGKHAQAASIRSEVGSIQKQITDLNIQIADRTRTADEFDTQAKARAAELDALAADVELARERAFASLGM